MKTRILTLAATTLLAGAILTGCSTPAEKVENAESNLVEANQDLDNANKEYLADVESYKKEVADRITANEESIKQFKIRIGDQKKEAKAEYNEKIKALEQKNSDIKKRMDDYKAESKEQWKALKEEFNRDIENLAKAFREFTSSKDK